MATAGRMLVPEIGTRQALIFCWKTLINLSRNNHQAHQAALRIRQRETRTQHPPVDKSPPFVIHFSQADQVHSSKPPLTAPPVKASEYRPRRFASCPRSGGHRKVQKEQKPCLRAGFFVFGPNPALRPRKNALASEEAQGLGLPGVRLVGHNSRGWGDDLRRFRLIGKGR